jgi:peptidoglycan/xylan/chitin deacetylase (PgdA/CDA1 family)
VKQALRETIIQLTHATGVLPVARRFFGGNGAILALHDVHADPRTELMTGVKASFLDDALGWLKRKGWRIVRLNDIFGWLERESPQQRFAVISFDDGYRGNFTWALPILERHSAPFTVFVPTGAPTRALYSWWLGLRSLFRTHDRVTIDAMERRFECSDLADKTSALAQVSQWVHQDLTRKPMLAGTFAAAGVSLPALNDTYFMDEGELRQLAGHPLATIGAHTSSHPALSTLSPDAARREMTDNRVYLEALLGVPIRHFAYPYGHERACGDREAAIAAEVGFASAVTTRVAPLSSQHRSQPHFLPRIPITAHETLASLDVRLSGLQTAVSSLLPRVSSRL